MMSVGPQTTKSDIFGYMDANGNYVTTEFRRRFEEGGVFLLDEIDAGHGGVLTAVNAALAGTLCAFPDGMIRKHEDFVCLAAGNTYGTGATREYVGRNQLDAATLDRFDFIDFPYDAALEKAIVASAGGDPDWVDFVQTVRVAVDELKLRHVVSPRASINGAKLLKAGRPRDEVVRTQVWKSLDVPSIEKVSIKVSALGNHYLRG
jgi:MoxR-like ATPase